MIPSQWRRRIVAALIAGFLVVPAMTDAIASAAEVSVNMEIPYSLSGKKTSVAPGEVVHAIISVECVDDKVREERLEIVLQPQMSFVSRQAIWSLSNNEGKEVLSATIPMAAGFGQWFDFVSLQLAADIPPGTYPIQVRLAGKELKWTLQVEAGAVENRVNKPALRNLVLPLDRDGRRDEKQSAGTLVLRDRSLDYYKNVLRGKGASNLEIEAIHPVTHLGLDFYNPGRQQRLLMVTAELLDLKTRQPIPGLHTPGSSGDNDGAGAMSARQDQLTAFVALNGETEQRLLVPVYADEKLMTEGRYWLRVVAQDERDGIWTQDMPLNVIKQNYRAVGALGVGLAFLTVFFVISVYRVRMVLQKIRTRRLITIALFGTCAFAVVNVPSTLLNDFFHILLGPFSFLITGMFSGVMLYMLIGALVTLIPLQGTVSLMMAVRLLLGMLAFGHMSPIVLLSYGVNAFLLEVSLGVAGVTSMTGAQDKPAIFSWRRIACLVLACALADTVATYIALQGMSVLYRLYFADWYIFMVMAVNGFVYTAVGAVCGTMLGRRLSEVGGD